MFSNYEIKKENDKYNIIIKNKGKEDKDLSDIINNYDTNKIYKITIIGKFKDKNDLLSKCINLKELTIKYCENIKDIPKTLINLKEINIIYCDYINTYRTPNILTLLNINPYLNFNIIHKDINRNFILNFIPKKNFNILN